jgi:hypothetical protein
LLAVTLSSCNGPFDAPNQNAGTLQDLTATPTRVGVLTATQGLLTLSRLSFGFNALTLGIFGREGYNLDVSNPQNIPNYYTVLGDLTAGVWTNAYRAFEQANLVTGALDRVIDMTAAEREGVRGFAQTMKALNLLYVIRGTDSSGAVLEVLSDPTAPPPNIVTKGQVYARIFQLLDSAQTHLQNAGSAFAFRLGSSSSTGRSAPSSTSKRGTTSRR